MRLIANLLVIAWSCSGLVGQHQLLVNIAWVGPLSGESFLMFAITFCLVRTYSVSVCRARPCAWLCSGGRHGTRTLQ